MSLKFPVDARKGQMIPKKEVTDRCEPLSR